MTETRVGHWKADRCEVYVGRGSIWGNPYVFPGKAKGSKHKVTEVEDPIAAYERHLRASPHLLAQLPTLAGKVLGCWCIRLGTPRSLPSAERCHAEVLARYADRVVQVVTDGRTGTIDGPTPLPSDFDRSQVAPPHPIYDGEPTMTFEEWWRSR